MNLDGEKNYTTFYNDPMSMTTGKYDLLYMVTLG